MDASSVAQAAQAAGVPAYNELTPATLSELASMLNDKVLPTTPYFFHSATFVFLTFLWAFTLLISRACALLFRSKYTKLNFDQRRTTDIYVLNCVLTTIAAVLQFVCLSAFSLDFKRWQFDVLRIASLLIASNYVFEMIYRPRMRYPMIAHHILTLFLVMLSLSVLYDVKDPTIMLSGNMLMFLATLEQPTFIALMLYRLRSPHARIWLRISSVQTILFKSIAAAGAIAVWIRWQRHNRPTTSHVYNILLWLSIGALYITQWYGAIVTWKIADSIQKRYQQDADDNEAGLDSSTSSGGKKTEKSALGIQVLGKHRGDGPDVEANANASAERTRHSSRSARSSRSRRAFAAVLSSAKIAIPNRSSSIHSPSPSIGCSPLPSADLEKGPSASGATSPTTRTPSVCTVLEPSYFARQKQQLYPVATPWQAELARHAVPRKSVPHSNAGHTDDGASEASVYEVPQSHLSHGGGHGDEEAEDDFEDEEAIRMRPAAARRA